MRNAVGLAAARSTSASVTECRSHTGDLVQMGSTRRTGRRGWASAPGAFSPGWIVCVALGATTSTAWVVVWPSMVSSIVWLPVSAKRARIGVADGGAVVVGEDGAVGAGRSGALRHAERGLGWQRERGVASGPGDPRVGAAPAGHDVGIVQVEQRDHDRRPVLEGEIGLAPERARLRRARSAACRQRGRAGQPRGTEQHSASTHRGGTGAHRLRTYPDAVHGTRRPPVLMR